MTNFDIYTFHRIKTLEAENAKYGDLWDADELTQTSTPGIQRYGVTLEGGHTYIIVNNAYAGYGGSRDNRTCYWWDEGGGVANGQLLAADGRTRAAVLSPSGTFHIWVGADPSKFFHVFRFDMGASTRKFIDEEKLENDSKEETFEGDVKK